MNRRRFVQSSVAGGLTLAVTPRALLGQAPTVMSSKPAKPVVIASANGNKFKNGGDMTCVQKAFTMMTKDNSDVLDALIAGVNIVELDPLDDSVGYGGLPNADGVVQLDSCCMHGPKRRAGGVACIEGVRTPSLVAKAVMEETDHHLIVGKGAQNFARNLGFKIEDDLNTENSRHLWLEWKRRIDPKHYLDPQKRAEAGRKAMRQMVAEGLIDERHIYGTINCNGINAKGEICGVTTTSGLAWKIPGRVGDSPILGAGLYVDGEIGAAGSTGRGEANLYNLCSFLIVESLRRGMHPKDAGMEACRRIKANTVEKRLLNSKGNPNFGINFYILNAKGEFAGVSMYPNYLRESTKEVVPSTYAVCTDKGAETLPCEALLDGRAED
ncbi:MAG TPA: N(4)-(beta-N-acetylglucosaminyl)-L-asparaginase [Chthoniobacterales bacterium]|jgi:N4-(beta-N-acetylglucosaminyl)-L-asparaginase|nr:N(4)-(beta-N-acetylglucosaminyl)-L-asparaginase [Chthoniobacterales bacterium]